MILSPEHSLPFALLSLTPLNGSLCSSSFIPSQLILHLSTFDRPCWVSPSFFPTVWSPSGANSHRKGIKPCHFPPHRYLLQTWLFFLFFPISSSHAFCSSSFFSLWNVSTLSSFMISHGRNDSETFLNIILRRIFESWTTFFPLKKFPFRFSYYSTFFVSTSMHSLPGFLLCDGVSSFFSPHKQALFCFFVGS